MKNWNRILYVLSRQILKNSNTILYVLCTGAITAIAALLAFPRLLALFQIVVPEQGAVLAAFVIPTAVFGIVFMKLLDLHFGPDVEFANHIRRLFGLPLLDKDKLAAKGLPFLSNPVVRRGSIVVLVAGLGSYLLHDDSPTPSLTFALVKFIVFYGLLPLWLIFGGKAADAKWKRDDEAERAKNYALVVQQQLDAQHPSIINIPLAGDLTDTAKKLAEEIRAQRKS